MLNKIAYGLLLSFAGSSIAIADDVQISADANTDYGIDNVATMLSPVILANDGLAVYQVAFDVAPPNGNSISSGASGGTTQSTSWAVSTDNYFSDFEYADINNIRIVNFNANGGNASLDDFSNLQFTSITIANGQSPGRDSVDITLNSNTVSNLGNLSDNPVILTLAELEAGDEKIESVRLAAGESVRPLNNKWSVNAIEVSVDVADIEEVPVVDLDLPNRGNLLAGKWGLFWGPELLANGASETLFINEFLDQIDHLKTLDYIQIQLGQSFIYSPVHFGPHPILESLWQGDYAADGRPLNLVVPREAAGIDPFLINIDDIVSRGLAVQVYVNSSNMLERAEQGNPDEIANITARWKAYVDTDPTVQAFLDSESFYRDDAFPDRHYMFAYAEFILKDYSERYGTLIESWTFDSGIFMSANGDNEINGVAADQRIFEAFANAARAGNPDAAVSFNNGPERETEAQNPFSEATRHDDFMFGHPYNGGRVIGNVENGLYDRNYAHVLKIIETDGFVHRGGIFNYDENVVGHFYPPMSTTAWNAGATAALSDEDFQLWTIGTTQNGGAITWGAATEAPHRDYEGRLLRDWSYDQLTALDAYLATNEKPSEPSWARNYTILASAVFDQSYSQVLVENTDFWDPEGDATTLQIVADSGAPSWLTLQEDPANQGHWLLSGTPTDSQTTEYNFLLQVSSATGSAQRRVTLDVGEASSVYPYVDNTQIVMLANTQFNVDEVVTMTSELIQTPDSQASFQIEFDVSPGVGTYLKSGDTTGLDSGVSWGVGDDARFQGDDAEAVTVNNLRITNFESTDVCLTQNSITDLSFNNVAIQNGQSIRDRVLISAQDIVNEEGGLRMITNPGRLNVRFDGYNAVDEMEIAVGSDLSANRWSINNINVSFGVQRNDEVLSDFDCDGVIDTTDRDIILSAMGSQVGDSQYIEAADLDLDGVITRRDYTLWFAQYRNQ